MPALDFKTLGAIVGKPAIHEWRCVVCFSCSCGKGKPMLLTAADQAAQCDGCGDIYTLSEMHYSRNNQGTGGVALARVPKNMVRPTRQTNEPSGRA